MILPPSYYSNYGSLVTYTCRHGTQFPDVADEDAIYQRVLRCNEDSKWGPNAQDCVSEYTGVVSEKKKFKSWLLVKSKVYQFQTILQLECLQFNVLKISCFNLPKEFR